MSSSKPPFSPWSTKRIAAAAAAADPRAIPNAEQQSLKCDVGKYEVRVTLEGWRSKYSPKWCVDSSKGELGGALYFEIQFHQKGGARPPKSASVVISLSRDQPSDPVPLVETYAPKNAIKGPLLSRDTQDDRRKDPNVNFSAGGFGGGGVSGWFRGRSEKYTRTKRWMLTSNAASPAFGTSTTGIDFTWTCGWPEDFSATNRKFRTALLLHRPSTCTEQLKVCVEATAVARSGFRVSPAQKKQPSDPIRPVHNLDALNYDSLRELLEQKIQEANCEVPEYEPKKTEPGQDHVVTSHPSPDSKVSGPYKLPATAQDQPQQLLASQVQSKSSPTFDGSWWKGIFVIFIQWLLMRLGIQVTALSP